MDQTGDSLKGSVLNFAD